MSESTWRQRIKLSRQYPAMFLGAEGGCLIPNSIRAPIKLMFETKAFYNVKSAILNVSPHQYHWTFCSDNIRKEIATVIDWEGCDSLADALGKSLHAVRNMQGKWTTPFQSNTNPLASLSCNVWFAEAGVLAVCSQQGLWWQIYHYGWPTTPPMLAENIDNNVGLVIAASLTKEWFDDIPFTLDAVNKAISEQYKSMIQVNWTDQDTIFSRLRFDAQSLNDNLDTWLF